MARLVVNVGGMFAGKSTELIREGKRSAMAKKKVIFIKPDFDNRYSENEIVTHDGDKVKALSLPTNQILILVKEVLQADVILIDEVQFFQREVVGDIEELLSLGKDVHISGLDLDFRGKPFEITSYLMGIADEVRKYKAVCSECGNDAWVSAKISDNQETRIELGADDKYVPLCRKCFYKKELSRRGEI